MPSGPATPPESCCDSGRADRKCEPDAGLWEGNAAWDAVEFDVTTPHYFQYEYSAADPDHVLVQAIGDPECDGTSVTYVLEGQMVDGKPKFKLRKANTEG